MKSGSSFMSGGGVLAVAVTVLALAGCGAQEGGKPKAAAGGAPPPAEVNVVVASKGMATLTQDLPGRLEAYRTAQVRARVDGIVEKRLFKEGSDVKAGDTLYQIDARTYQTAYDSAKADVDVARQTVARYKPLLEAKAVSQQDYDLAVAKLKQAEVAMAKAQLDLDNTRVPAPIAGRIGRALVTEGALVGHGDATQLATVEQVDPIYANFTEPGADMLRLRKEIDAGKLKRSESTQVELVLEDGTVYSQQGKLLFSDLAVDPGTGSVSLRAKFPNPKHELLPGMFVRVRFSEATSDDAIKLPQRALESGPQGQFVMVVDAQGKVAPRPVTTGGMAGGDFIISKGLNGGEQVIVDGLQKARPGSTVKAVVVGDDNSPAVPAAEKH
ncbi:MAG: efflux RND transporter periplasmic adaptor subunit [Sideroxydans sp.]|nr:efflux RND transporter periplasmic adaptor subunit [Sideroxydans sp.]